MSKAKKICLDESQTERLMTDTTKLAKGIDEDICPTVREMYHQNVPEDLRVGKAKKKSKDSGIDVTEAVVRRVAKKAKAKAESFLDGLF